MTTIQTTIPGLDRVRCRFLEKLNEREQRLSKAIATSRTSFSRRERAAALDECQQILHKLAGTAGTIGLHDIGEGAQYCEDAIRKFLHDGSRSSEHVHDLLDRFMDGLAAMAER